MRVSISVQRAPTYNIQVHRVEFMGAKRLLLSERGSLEEPCRSALCSSRHSSYLDLCCSGWRDLEVCAI